MKRLAILVALAACGDNGKGGGGTDGGVDTPPDGMPPGATLTSYVIDLVQNQTANDTEPRPFAEIAALPDPDTENAAAYAPLFP
ncbi:MAG TPA: hypothetical protein VFQ53_24685 [Kofleriaceae bacterium]|nr:hypothetical protein [Kofleriaceae bacterium]